MVLLLIFKSLFPFQIDVPVKVYTKIIHYSGGRQPRKKHHPKFQKLIFQKCVQKVQNVNLKLS